MDPVRGFGAPRLQVRALAPGDVEPLTALVAATGVFQPYEVSVARELLEAGAGRGDASGYLFRVAQETPAGGLLGYACYGETPCTQGTFDLYWIATDPAAQGRGVASRLLEAVVEDLALRSARLVVAETEGSPSYFPARALYEKSGFRRAADIPDFYRPGVSKIVYVKPLISEGGR